MTEPQQSSSAQPSAARHASASTSGRPSTSKRVSTVAAPKAPTSVHPTALIAGHAVLTGTNLITVGPKAVVHPYARINSTNGPINLGEASVIWEGAMIGAPSGDKNAIPSDSMKETASGQGVDLGPYVVVESGAVVEAASIGEGTLIEVDAKVGKGAVVGKHCKITPHSILPPGSTLPDFTVLFGANQRRLDRTLVSYPNVVDLKAKAHRKHLETLQRLVPSHTAKWQ